MFDFSNITLIKNNDNTLIIKKAKKELSDVNDKFVKFIKKNNISKVNLTSVGNSLATGYSMNDSIKPLLLRNEDLINKADFDLNLRAYARAQDNNDEHIFEWFLKNIKQSDINKRVQLDFISEKGMPHDNIYRSDVIKYYPTNIENDIGLHDIMMQNEEGLANIIVYNGVTGSFLDNVTRHGLHKGLYGFKRDLVSLESSLKLIYLRNPYTQVYVCGIPDFRPKEVITAISKTIIKVNVNNKIKKICKNYPNCVYVDPAKQNLLYRKNDSLVVDVHYSDDEYLNLNRNILEAIIHNYIPVKAMVEFDLIMKNYSNKAEYGDRSDITEMMNGVFSKYSLSSDKLKEMIKYFKERYPYDFYYTPRTDVINDIKSRNK